MTIEGMFAFNRQSVTIINICRLVTLIIWTPLRP